MKIVVFGTGILFERNREKLRGMDIVAFLDNDPEKQGTYINNILVLSPEKIKELSYDFVFLASRYYPEMRKQLLSYDVPNDRIIDREHRGVFEGIRYVKKIGQLYPKDNKKRVLLVSHHMGLTGAPIVLYKMAEILKKNDFYVEVCAIHEGELVYKCVMNGIPVTIYDNFIFSQNEMKHYFSEYDAIVVNTVTLYDLISQLAETTIPILWWLHEEDDVYETYSIDKDSFKFSSNIHIYGVGSRAIDSYQKRIGGSNISNLPYGIEEKKVEKRMCINKKLVFAIIGSVGVRKGNDVFAKAIVENASKWIDKAEFWMIGEISEEFRKEYESTGLIKVWGVVDHDKMLELYSQIDVVVCPSRNDPLPVVVTEGMMNEKVCIVSDMTGSSDYITPYENGLICRAGDVRSLADCIEWVLDHKYELMKIGRNAYQVYRENFSIEQFEKNILKIFNDF